VLARGEQFSISPRPGRSGRNTFHFQQKTSVGTPFEIQATLEAPGEAAIGNAGLAIACVRALEVHSDVALQKAAQQGLEQCALPARIEVLANDPRVIVDAAHTAESARTLADALVTLAPDGFELILSVSSDKNLDALLDALLPGTRRIWLTEADRIRSMRVDVMAKSVRERAPSLRIEVVADPEEAARRARATLATGSRLCSAGSIYLAGVVRRVLGPGQRTE
jgi:dihydrofolate synthase/folylpolyglutamate synthase